jgi:hypothetical protein
MRATGSAAGATKREDTPIHTLKRAPYTSMLKEASHSVGSGKMAPEACTIATHPAEQGVLNPNTMCLGRKQVFHHSYETLTALIVSTHSFSPTLALARVRSIPHAPSPAHCCTCKRIRTHMPTYAFTPPPRPRAHLTPHGPRTSAVAVVRVHGGHRFQIIRHALLRLFEHRHQIFGAVCILGGEEGVGGPFGPCSPGPTDPVHVVLCRVRVVVVPLNVRWVVTEPMVETEGSESVDSSRLGMLIKRSTCARFKPSSRCGNHITLLSSS